MINGMDLAGGFAVNSRVITWQTKGLSHEDSLLQPPFRGNCLNWVLGHVLIGRQDVLRALQMELVVDEAELDRYRSGSEPVGPDSEGILSLEQLLDALSRAQAGIAEGLSRATPEALAAPSKDEGSTVIQHIFGLYFHDTYHVGQTELLRQLAGTNDKVI